MKLSKHKLGELIEVTRGASLSGQFYAEEGEFVRLTLGNFNMNGGGFKENTSKTDLYYTGTVKDEFILNKDDIITPLTEQSLGLLGTTARIPESGKYIQSQDVALVKCKKGLLDPNFCYYLISSSVVHQQLSAGAQQTKIRHTSPDKIKDCTVWIPELEVQKRIGRILYDIDEKIALNRQINDNLEAMAKQLYDYWFVQFDFPNEEGKPYKSSGGAMVWNEKLKREIPKGWSVKNLEQIATSYQQGLIRSNNQLSTDSKYGYLKMGDLDGKGQYTLQGLTRTNATNEEVDLFSLHKGDFLINVRNSKEIVGKTCLIGYVERNTLYNHMLVRLDFKDVSTFYMNLLFNSEFMYKALDGLKQGTTTVIALYQNDLYRLPILVPAPCVMEQFSKITDSILDQKEIISYEIEELTKQRDDLLPLLMNGQATVNYHLSVLFITKIMLYYKETNINFRYERNNNTKRFRWNESGSVC